MQEEKKIEPFYQARAKDFVDVLFDKGYFREDVSRDGMNDVEDLLAYFVQSYCESAVKCVLLTKKIKGRKE
jgi:hypothetical protein